MLATTHEVSIKGQICSVPAFRMDDIEVVVRGGAVKIAEIFDEYWLLAEALPDPLCVLEELRSVANEPDIFTFAQRVPDIKPRFEFHTEWDNVAVIPVSTHDTWFREQISSASRRNIRASEKKGVVVREDKFDEAYVRGIMSIYNEASIRQGRKFWHYGKEFEAVERENGTYRERSSFLGAYIDGQMVGYMKIVWDRQSAAIMQVLSKLEFREKRPNNAMLSEAVRLCAERKVPNLLYEKYVYGTRTDSSLTRFKRENGFVRMDLPRYYVPLTVKGKIAVALRLYKDPKDLIPEGLRTFLVGLRDNWYASRKGSDFPVGGP